MQYFKHSDLADTYHVSLKTVHNWIDAAKQGKVELKLCKTENRTYIANTPENIMALKQLSEKGKKYRNTLHHKTIKPKKEFYDIYNRRQILDIITSLDVHGEIPRQYNYFSEGAANWDNWQKKLAAEDDGNILQGTLELIRSNLVAIDNLIEDGRRINVIDLGVGNAYPVKELLGHLVDKGVLHRYIGIDISSSMLRVAEENIRQWYGDKVNFEGYVRDMTHERFDDLVIDDMLDDEANKTINLVLLFGGTSSNFRLFEDVFKVIYSSMGANDLLMYADKPDTEATRRYFDFSSIPGINKLSPNHQYILELMNIDESLYDVEMGYNPVKRMRYIRVRLKSAISVEFSFEGKKRVIQIEKGDVILLLRVSHRTALEIISEFEKVGFTLLQSSLTKDRQFFLSISGVEPRGDKEN